MIEKKNKFIELMESKKSTFRKTYANYPIYHISKEVFNKFTGDEIKHHRSKCNLCPKCLLWRTFGKLCDYCKPKESNKLYKKTKEMIVIEFLKNNLPNNDFIHNK